MIFFNLIINIRMNKKIVFINPLTDKEEETSIFDGEWYTIPGDLHPLAVYYNVDLLEKAGLNPNELPNSGGEFFEWLVTCPATDWFQENDNVNGITIYFPVDEDEEKENV